MKKIFKKSLCVLMAVVMIACAVPFSAFAADSGVNKTPIIFISGIGNTTLYRNKGTSNQKTVFYPQFDWGDVLDLLKGLTQMEDHGYDYTSYMQKVFVPFLQKYLEDVRCDGNGNSVYPVQIDSTNLSYAENHIAREKGGIVSDVQKIAAQTIGANRVFRLTYDYRLSAIEAAQSLRTLVEHVKQVTGSDKVRLIGVSMGGAVLDAYLNMYTHSDLDTIYFLSSAAEGTNFPAEIFMGKLNLTRDTMASCLKNLVDVIPAAVIASLETGIGEVNTLWSGANLTYFYDNWIKPYIGKWAGLWSLIPSDKIDSCIDFMLDKKEDAGLIQKIKTYQSYQDKLPEVLKQVKKDGVKIYVTSSYNLNGLPFEGNDGQGDIIIDLQYCSLGATAATFTQGTLGDNYKQKVNDGKNRLSCDGIVDASTCAVPDSTWIIKNIMHCMLVEKTDDGKVDNSGVFFKWLISSKTQLTVESDSKYPQFLDYTKSSGTLVPLTKVVIDETTESSDYISSAVTTYTYTQLTALGWALIALIALAVVLIIVKANSGKEQIDGVLSKKEIKALPKAERKGAKKNNKALKKQFKKDKKAQKKARKAELKAMPKKERKAAKKTDKALKKAGKKEMKLNKKAAKAEKKAAKKTAKAEKKAAAAGAKE